MNKVLYIVIPAYDEEEVIVESMSIISSKLSKLIKMKKVSKNSKIVVVDDGSRDNTLELLKELK